MSSPTASSEEIQFIDDDPVIDLEIAAPSGHPCAICGAPLEHGDRFCVTCGAADAKAEDIVTAQAIEVQHIRCETCGAEIETKLDQRSYVCPFCESTYVVEVDAETDRQPPEFVIGFSVSAEQAQQKFLQWIRSNGFFHPADLKHVQLGDRLRGVYLPFWSFSMLARSHWRSRIGEYWYRTETYTTMENGKLVTKTRQVRETEWWSLDGRHHHYYSGYLVSASKGLSQAEADQIKPFNLPALKRYQPYFLAGWQAEEYTVSRDDALRASQAEFRRREQANIGAFLPGDTFDSLQFETEFSEVNSDLCLLPVYMMNYTYRGTAYRFLINGQTGKIVGDKPYSKTKIGLVIGGIVLGVVLIVLFFLLVAGGLLAR